MFAGLSVTIITIKAHDCFNKRSNRAVNVFVLCKVDLTVLCEKWTMVVLFSLEAIVCDDDFNCGGG